MSRPIHEVKPLQARLVRSWETRLEVRVLSVHAPAAEIEALLAQWIRYLPPKQGIPGSSPGQDLLNTSGVVVT